jgi:RNA polymerase sigma factor (sigma-70 family)
MENLLIDRPSTADILQRLAAGADLEAWSLLVERHGQAIYNAAYRVCGEHALAEDATQETFLHIRQDARRFRLRPGDGEASAQGWIMRIACTSTLQLLRQRGRQNRREHTFAVEHARNAQGFVHVGEDEDQTRLSAALRHELAELPDSHRLPLLLHYYGGLDYQSIAQQMGCTAGNARVRVHRALERLRGRLVLTGVLVGGTDLAGYLHAVEAPSAITPALLTYYKGLATSSALPATSTVAVLGGTSVLAKVGIAAGSCLMLGALSLPVVLKHTPPPASTPPVRVRATQQEPVPALASVPPAEAPVAVDQANHLFHAMGSVVRLNVKEGRVFIQDAGKILGFSLHRHGNKSPPDQQELDLQHVVATLTVGSTIAVAWVAMHPPAHDAASVPALAITPGSAPLNPPGVGEPALPGPLANPDQGAQAAAVARRMHHRHHDSGRLLVSITVITLAPANLKLPPPPLVPESTGDF